MLASRFRLSSLLLALAVLVSTASAQFVTPASRVVVLGTGKTAKVTVDAAGCKPTYAAVSGDEDVATVSPAEGKASGKASFKIKAGGDAPGMTTVTITLTDAECIGDPLAIDIDVYVVMDTKAAEKAWKSGMKGLDMVGVNGRLKTLKTELKDAQKELAANYKDLLGQVADGTLDTPAFLGGDPLPLHDQAMLAAFAFEITFLKVVYASWYFALAGMASDGRVVLSYLGFVSYMPFTVPVGFTSGGCGLWDSSRLKAFALVLGTIDTLNKLSKAFAKSLAKLTSTDGVATRETPATIVDGSLAAADPSNVGFDANTDPCQDGSSEIVKLKAYNSFDGDNDNGRILLVGRAAAGSTVTVTYQKLDANGDPEGDPVVEEVVASAECVVNSTAPAATDAPNLEPGTWQVTMETESGTTLMRRIQVPVN
ncbi:MAG: hypothetical protein H6825_11580 [Planctomycetes bacterium]|nr:hypothetical protein [Planctomycetota bacterium]